MPGLTKVHHRRASRPGQILVLMAVATLVLIMFTGLAIDLAQFLIFRAQARRAVDAAAMTAAAHFRSQYETAEAMKRGMRAAVEEVMALHGFDIHQVEVITSMDREDEEDPSSPLICDDPATDINQVPDKYLCFPRQRKKVWVKTWLTYDTAFIRLFGLKQVTLSVSAVGEAATLDVVLVIDISGSMAYGRGVDPTRPDHPLDDPAVCNQHPGDLAQGCLPFEYIRAAAKQFAEQILDLSCHDPTDPDNCLEQDRLAIVVFSTGWESDPAHSRGTYIVWNGSTPWFKRASEAKAVLDDLRVYDPGVTTWDWQRWVEEKEYKPNWAGSVRNYLKEVEVVVEGKTETVEMACDPDSGDPDCTYRGYSCVLMLYPEEHAYADVSTCMSTNIGGALREARRVLLHEYRPDALQVVILLSTGVPNATFASWVREDVDWDPINPPSSPDDDYPLPSPPPTELTNEQLSELPFGYCPESTQWYLSPPTPLPPCPPGTRCPPHWTQCRDLDVAKWDEELGWWVPSIRTSFPDPNDPNDPNANFDAEDYAYSYGHKLGCPTDLDEALERGCPFKGLGAVIFTVGIGEEVISREAGYPGDPPAGAFFLRYLAALGDDNDPRTDPCRDENAPFEPPGDRQKCGNYFWLREGSDVGEVLDEIAREIFTRLSH